MNDGYASSSTLARLMEGVSHLNGHNVLMKDMKGDAWVLHIKIRELEEKYRGALIAAYCVPAKEDGTLWTKTDLANAQRCSVYAYRKRLDRAKKMLVEP